VAPGQSVWTKENVQQLTRFCDLHHMLMLRACYIVAKKDGSVFVESCNTTTSETATPKLTGIDEYCEIMKWNAKTKVDEYKKDRACPIRQLEYFHHITRVAARTHCSKVECQQKAALSSQLDLACLTMSETDYNLKPSEYLDVVTTADQQKLLNPEYKDVVSAQLLNDAVGDGAKKLMAKCRIDMITGNLNSYSKICNSKEHLNHAIQMNQLVSVIGSMKADTDIEKAAKAAAKKADDD